ncbi:hypothetical protein MO973_24670 [Paenibacillus sp. TRM 82003]|nr:hypothetical protein [Paenibacillus sp. TRM 82003]MCI3923425.1 hypothetical protein [Paenibacillus sp. TRM 82003]
MKKTWGKTAGVALLTAAMLTTGAGAATADTGTPAEAKAAAGTATQSVYKVNASLHSELKSLVTQRTATGVRVGAVVRLKNVTGSIARVPDYELHALTAEGISYKLDGSAGNARSIRPQAEVEVSYMADIDGLDALDVKSLQWVDVNKYVYPRTQKVVVEMPSAGRAWTGITAEAPTGLSQATWGVPFTLEGLKSPLVYTPVAVSEQTTASMGMTTVIRVLVKNPSAFKQTVPALAIEGHDGKEAFAGLRAETGEIVLLPNEDTFIHLALPKKPDSKFTNVVLSTPESFAVMGKDELIRMSYNVGRVSLALPTQPTSTFVVPKYELGQSVNVSQFSDMIPENVGVALVEMSMHETEGAGYQTVVAKFRVDNTGDKALPIPPLMTEMQSAEGYQYVGVRQSNAPTQVLPGLATVVAYTFTVPASETGKGVTLKLQEPVRNSDLRSDLAAVKLDAAQPGTERTFSFYPYTVELRSKQFTAMYNAATGYSYKLKMDLTVTQEEKVVTDRDFSLMEIEIVDAFGRSLGSSELSFVSNLPNGNRRVISGETVVNFSNLRTEQFENNLTIRIYESIQTQTGTVRRLVTSIK